MPCDPRTARSTTSFSTGGTPSCGTMPAAPERISRNNKPASRTTGRIANVQIRAAGARSVVVSGITTRPRGFEQAHPSELRELTLMSVEHELARVPEAGFENRPLPLTQHQRVGRFIRCERRPGAIGIEEHAVQVNAVDQVELGDVDHVHPHELPDLDANGIVHEV